MKYTITLTAEDLAFVETLQSDSIAELTRSIHNKLNGKIVDPRSDIEKDWGKLERLCKPIKKQAEGTTEICKICADRLNSRLGTRYRHNSQSMKTHVSARVREGYTAVDFIQVIDKKIDEWRGTEQEKYLRPETLFGTKFEGYLNQFMPVGDAPTTEQQRNTDYNEGLDES